MRTEPCVFPPLDDLYPSYVVAGGEKCSVAHTPPELVDAFIKRVQEGHGKQVSREQAASLVREE